MEGISPEANLLLFHFARSSSLIRYSLESTLFHRQSDTVRVAFRCERPDDVRGVGSVSNVHLFLLLLFYVKDTEIYYTSPIQKYSQCFIGILLIYYIYVAYTFRIFPFFL